MRKVGGPPPPARPPRAPATQSTAKRSPARGAAKSRVHAGSLESVDAEEAAREDGLDRDQERDRSEEAWEEVRRARERDDAKAAFKGFALLSSIVEAVRPAGTGAPQLSPDHPEHESAAKAHAEFVEELSNKGIRGVGRCEVRAGIDGRPAIFVEVHGLGTLPPSKAFSRSDLGSLPKIYQGFSVIVALPYGNLPLRGGR